MNIALEFVKGYPLRHYARSFFMSRRSSNAVFFYDGHLSKCLAASRKGVEFYTSLGQIQGAPSLAYWDEVGSATKGPWKQASARAGIGVGGKTLFCLPVDRVSIGSYASTYRGSSAELASTLKENPGKALAGLPKMAGDRTWALLDTSLATLSPRAAAPERVVAATAQEAYVETLCDNAMRNGYVTVGVLPSLYAPISFLLAHSQRILREKSSERWVLVVAGMAEHAILVAENGKIESMRCTRGLLDEDNLQAVVEEAAEAAEDAAGGIWIVGSETQLVCTQLGSISPAPITEITPGILQAVCPIPSSIPPEERDPYFWFLTHVLEKHCS